LIAAALLCVLSISRGAESPATSTRRPQPERWLLIVDTSSAMERRAKAVEGVVGELIVSGMNGQMEPGAELGIWTYNKELFAGVAPMQTWDPARSNLMASRTVGFLSKQPYRSKSKPEPVIAELNRVVGDSRRLTVVWLSDGAGEKIAGTPFDDLINEAFAKYRPALSKTRMPLITILRVYHGKYIGQNVSVSPWPVEFPAFPIDPEKTNTLAKSATVVAKPAEPVKSIYISSPKKPDAEKPAPVEVQGGGVKLRPPPESVVPDVVPPPKPAESVPAQPLPVAVTEPTPVVAPAEPAPSIKPVEATPAPAVVPVAAAAPLPSIATPSPAAPVVAPATPVVPAPQVAIATNTVAARKWPLILGIGFMTAAIMAALVLARRARRASASSLITRSFDRDQK